MHFVLEILRCLGKVDLLNVLVGFRAWPDGKWELENKGGSADRI